MILCCDFGSTFTKLTAIDGDTGKIIAKSRAFTTIDSNVMDGFSIALDEIHKQCSIRNFETRLAASSAAGGLKMVAAGLVPDLTAKASRLAAASAGAKVLKTYSYELTDHDLDEITKISPDIILLSGGIDGGNKDVLLRNAKSLAKISGDFCVIIAGNRSAADEANGALQATGKRTVVCENVMPQFGKLNIEPAKTAIRELFIQNIISAKGLDKAQEYMTAEIIPTPLAVFEAAKLLSEGINDGGLFEEGLGPLMVFDLGGATTDVYSMADGLPKNPQVYVQGLLEPYAKRTVEGDIGMRYSLAAMLEAMQLCELGSPGTPCHPGLEEGERARAGQETFASFTVPNANGSSSVLGSSLVADIHTWRDICLKTPSALPIGEYAHFQQVEHFLAGEAIKISAARHVGFYERSYTPMGETIIQTGKDLTQVKYVIGTGGAIIDATEPFEILQSAIYSPQDLNLLKPQSPKLLLDSEYCLSAMGLLAGKFPRLALKIMRAILH